VREGGREGGRGDGGREGEMRLRALPPGRWLDRWTMSRHNARQPKGLLCMDRKNGLSNAFHDNGSVGM
jgi:hypothetical protein